ncbi:DUF5134 domain-containing protein [Nocardia sp. NPDC005998]|uniref:DUF5134 domain-containing protein n=1 Tax=Nocardia sp. NPDC005998 TaxID=3156894 RepID=UPI0033A987F7
MITDPFLKWAATVAFVVAAVFWAMRAGARSATIPGRITGVLQIVMSSAMLAMVWPRLPNVSTVAGMTVFATAAAIFLVLRATQREHHIENGYHALKMATMVWMYAVMDESIVGGTQTSSGDSTMDMGGGTTMSMPTTMTMQLPSWAGYLDLAIGLAYLATTAAWVAYTYRQAPTDHAHRRTGAMQAMMAAAMAAMFLSYIS